MTLLVNLIKYLSTKFTYLTHSPVDTRRKLDVHKTSRRRPGRYTHEKTRKTFGFLLFSEGVKWGRNSRQEVFCKKGVLENFAKFTGKHLCQNLF